jgi:SAM-dependent methyltransferase
VSFLESLWWRDGVRSVLDLCCGTGLLGAELLPRGYEVVGVDASQAMLDVARGRLGPGPALHLSTLPELRVDGVFDAAVSIQDGFTYLTLAGLAGTFVEVARCLRPAGWLVFDLHTDAMLEFTAANPVVVGDGFVISSSVDGPGRSCETAIEVTGPEPFMERHEQYFHREDDVRAALAAAGFRVTGLYDGHSEAPASISTLTATWVSRLS